MDYSIEKIQQIVREFAKSRNWEDYPNIDKFDHVHEELIEVSQYLRYKSREEMEGFLSDPKNKALIEEEMGDVLFVFARLANQLNIDLGKGFETTVAKVLKKFPETAGKSEYNPVWKGDKPGNKE